MIHSKDEIKELIKKAIYISDQIKEFVGKEHLKYCDEASVTIDLDANYITVNYYIASDSLYKDRPQKNCIQIPIDVIIYNTIDSFIEGHKQGYDKQKGISWGNISGDL